MVKIKAPRRFRDRVFESLEESPTSSVDLIFRRAEQKKYQVTIKFILPEKWAFEIEKAAKRLGTTPEQIARDATIEWLQMLRCQRCDYRMATDASLLKRKILVDKDEAFAICFLNLKGYKDKDIYRTAKALQYLKNLPEYGSNEKVGEAVGVSGEVVREFLTLFKLPEPIQDLFRERKLIWLEQCRRLWQLAKTRPNVLEETANAIFDITAWDSRQVIEHIIRNPSISVLEAKKAVLESKPEKKNEYHVIALLDEEYFKLLSREAVKRNVSVSSLVTSVVQKWLESQSDNAR